MGGNSRKNSQFGCWLGAQLQSACLMSMKPQISPQAEKHQEGLTAWLNRHYCQACWLEFDSWEHHGGKREGILQAVLWPKQNKTKQHTYIRNWSRWYISENPSLRRQRHEGIQSEANLGYILSGACLANRHKALGLVSNVEASQVIV